MNIVEARNVNKTLNGNEIIRDFYMEVPQYSVYGFLGENGAGKTTVFKLLTGLLQPASGTINISGMDISTKRKEILRQVGLLIEKPVFFEHLSAKENLEIHLRYMEAMAENIESTLELVGLKNISNQPVSQFSLGMRQRLGIARAIIHQPKLLILDEPINGLDPKGIKKMRDLFIKLVEDYGMTILVSSHLLSELEHVADKIGIIANGSMLEEINLHSISQGLENYYFQVLERG